MDRMHRIVRYLPWIAGVLALVGASLAVLPPRAARGFDVDAFAQLPVLEGGRVKPIDSVARNSLLVIRSQQSFRFEDRTIGPEEWLLDVLFRPEVADRQPIFVINDPEVLGLMGLQQSSNRYFTFAAIAPHIQEIQRQAQAAQQVEAAQRTRFQSAVANLFERLYLYFRLKNTLQVSGSPGLAPEVTMAAAPGAGPRHQALEQLAHFRPIPPEPGTTGDGWLNVGQALSRAAAGQQAPALGPWARLSVAYMAQDPGSFDRAVADVRAADAAVRPEAVAQAGHEVVFNRAQPFYSGMVVYVLALLLLFASWAWKPRLLQPAAFGLLVGGRRHPHRWSGLPRDPAGAAAGHEPVLVRGLRGLGRRDPRGHHRAHVPARLRHRGRVRRRLRLAPGGAPPLRHRRHHGDDAGGARLELLARHPRHHHHHRLRGTFLAGVIAIVYVLRKHLAKRPDPETSKALVAMIYGIICFATVLQLRRHRARRHLGRRVLGPLLGLGSQGERRAHHRALERPHPARPLGRLGPRARLWRSWPSSATSSPAWSWFGVNMLGVGLHSYGFMDSAFYSLTAFIGSQLLLMAFALAPARFWSSAPAAGKAARGAEAPEPGR